MVLIGVDPNKATHTAVVIDDDERELARIKVKADRSQVAALLEFAATRTAAATRESGLRHQDECGLRNRMLVPISLGCGPKSPVRALNGDGHRVD